jgi:esterase
MCQHIGDTVRPAAIGALAQRGDRVNRYVPRVPEPIDRYLEINGRRFHYRDWAGSGSTPLVLLHGIFLAARTYDLSARRLAEKRRVVVIDQRGHGETDRAEEYGWTTWVDDLVGIWDAVSLDGADLVGHSLGARNAMHFADRHGGRIRRLVLVEGGFGPFTNPDQERFWHSAIELFPPDGFESPEAFVALAAREFPRASRAALEDTANALVEQPDGRWKWPYEADPGVGQVFVDRGPSRKEESALRKSVDIPVLIVQAEHSELFVGDRFRDVAAEYPNGAAVMLAASGHLVMWENAAALVDCIEKFLT